MPISQAEIYLLDQLNAGLQVSSADTSNFVMPLRFENFQGIEVAVRPGLQTVNQLLRHNYNADQHMSNKTNVQVEQKDVRSGSEWCVAIRLLYAVCRSTFFRLDLGCDRCGRNRASDHICRCAEFLSQSCGSVKARQEGHQTARSYRSIEGGNQVWREVTSLSCLGNLALQLLTNTIVAGRHLTCSTLMVPGPLTPRSSEGHQVTTIYNLLCHASML